MPGWRRLASAARAGSDWCFFEHVESTRVDFGQASAPACPHTAPPPKKKLHMAPVPCAWLHPDVHGWRRLATAARIGRCGPRAEQ